MRAAPIARYLVELDPHEDPRAARAGGMEPIWGRVDAAAEAHAKGFEAGKEAAKRELAARLEAQADAYRRELAAAREDWVRKEGARLGEQLAQGMRDIEARTADAVARILKPFLAADLRHKAVCGLVETLSLLRTSDSAAAVSVTGPADLLDAVRAGLAGKLDNVSFHPGQACDVQVTVGRTVLETRLGSWLARVGEAGA
jgi:hypothetical protein